MNEDKRLEIIKTSWEIHRMVESSYLSNPVKPGDEDWLEKQRMLLADMALHLLQTAIKPGDVNLERLRDISTQC